MRRALVVAGVEFRALVRTRSFLIGLLLPPVLGGLGALASWATRPPEPGPPPPLRIAVLDHGGSLFGALEVAAGRRNAAIGAREARFELERIDPHAADPDGSWPAWESRMRDGELQALVEIPAGAGVVSADPVRLRVVARDGTREDLAGWLEAAVREELRTRALRGPGVSAALRARVERSVETELGAPAPLAGEARGLAPDPLSAPALARDALRRLGPFQRLALAGPLAMILLVVVSVAAAPLFQAVLEEKTSRVSEILVSSISPFELMLGKLLGSLGAGGISAAIYAGTVLALLKLVFGAAVPLGLVGLFVVYLVLALLLWGSLFLALGAACSDIKDAQNLMVPLLVLQVLPLLLATNIASQPAGGLARSLSLFPPTAPIAMLLRLGHDPGPPTHEILLSLVLLAAAVAGAVWAAGRVLRVGLLAHGRGASLREILRWVRTG